jgi:lipoate-protein ligase B
MTRTETTTDLYGWVLDLGEVEYRRVLNWQRGLVKLRKEGFARDTLVFVQHPPVVTVGRDGHEENFKGLKQEPFFVERGGDVTYHGPGQLVVYYIFNLARRGRDLHKFMQDIQHGIIDALAEFGVSARTGDEYTGVWVGKKKIASIGIAVKNWITYHGSATNISTDLKDFETINPCGLQADIMTSLERECGRKVTLPEFSAVLLEKYSRRFNTAFTPISLEQIAEDVESQEGGNEV